MDGRGGGRGAKGCAPLNLGKGLPISLSNLSLLQARSLTPAMGSFCRFPRTLLPIASASNFQHTIPLSYSNCFLFCINAQNARYF
jgi:hypothetical protein